MKNSTGNLGLSLIFALGLGACASAPPPEAAAPIVPGGEAQKLDGERYLEYRVGVEIEADADAVWALLTDAERYPEWNSTITELNGSIALGETIALRSTVDPKRTFKLKVSAFEPGERLVWEDGGRSFKGVRTFTITERADGTTTVTMAEVLTGTMMGMIEGKLPDFRPSFDAFAADLKRAAEASGANEAS